MTQAEFVRLAQTLAGQLLHMRDETSETPVKEAIENGEEPTYWFNGNIDRKDLDAVLAYQPEDEHETTENDEAYRKAAIKQWASVDINIDSASTVSIADYGAFVEAWVWVPDSAIDTTATDQEDNKT